MEVKIMYVSKSGTILYLEVYPIDNLVITIPGDDILTGTWKPLGFNLWRKIS
jgi:hypothetical protein